jgi:dienelactone hydrolase
MLRKLSGVILAFMMTAPALGAVKGEAVEYQAGGTVLKGYIAYDDAVPGKRPGVLVVHDWWGHGEFVRGQARALAGLGYTALAVDMYGGGQQAHDPDTAGKLSGGLRKAPPTWRARFDAAHDLLRRHKTVDGKRIVAVGYSFGGSTVLEAARRGRDLAGVVSFYGDMTTQHPAAKGKTKAKVLVMYPTEDPMLPVEQLNKFKQEMDAAKADYRVVSLPGAKHLFNRPDADEYGKKFNMPLAYNAEADKKSWAEMQAFFDRLFKK